MISQDYHVTLCWRRTSSLVTIKKVLWLIVTKGMGLESARKSLLFKCGLFYKYKMCIKHTFKIEKNIIKGKSHLYTDQNVCPGHRRRCNQDDIPSCIPGPRCCHRAPAQWWFYGHTPLLHMDSNPETVVWNIYEFWIKTPHKQMFIWRQ